MSVAEEGFALLTDHHYNLLHYWVMFTICPKIDSGI